MGSSLKGVAGLLLLDPANPTGRAALQKQAPATAAALRDLRANEFTPTMKVEFDDRPDSTRRVEACLSPDLSRSNRAKASGILHFVARSLKANRTLRL
ncbi:MAG: hypothetical protein CFE44_20255 [Burkholderiales bacterium PBB4]|nr:MAG: hypothetical protein CFE44_20255 [Burkholderiales bacterium PBB4]